MKLIRLIQQFFRKSLGLDLRIGRVRPGTGPITDRYPYQKARLDFGITPGESVLDIGSGQDPFPLATHLADLYPAETSHRQSVPLVRDARPFTECGIENLPFQSQEFDFIYASHILEHVMDPGQACRELMRVGRRGYIETPTRTSDVMLNYLHLPEHHRWHITLVGETLIFTEYTAAEKSHDMGTNFFFSQLHSQDSNPFQEMFQTSLPIFYNLFLWNKHFSFYVFDKNGILVDTNVESRKDDRKVGKNQ
jgi:2-polyprenyl-3-methyl-5-hydroxy-6-metoxy-1,4-benzoquinol methylase